MKNMFTPYDDFVAKMLGTHDIYKSWTWFKRAFRQTLQSSNLAQYQGLPRLEVALILRYNDTPH